MKMTTAVPPGIATPDRLETSLGVLKMSDGIPDEATTRTLLDHLDLSRATAAFLNCIPIASMHSMRQSILRYGPANATVVLFADLMDSRALWLTPNTTSIYMTSWLEFGSGDGDNAAEPMVLETPPNVLGIIDDAWFHFVADFGNAGADRGEGGRYLILPPGRTRESVADPDQYTKVVSTRTYGNWLIWRGFQVDGSPGPAAEQTRRLFRMYPLSAAAAPPAMTFVDISGTECCSIHRMDYGYWEELDGTIQQETLDGLDVETRGLLAAIGIQKGKPFRPDARMKAILEDGAKIGSVTARTLVARPRDARHYLYPGERVSWTNPFVQGRYDFVLDGARLLDSRIYMHYYATGITPAMALKLVGKGSQYAVAYLDKSGRPFAGDRTYKVNLPKNVPAKDFWSFTVYDNQTRSMLQTDQRFPGIDSNQEGLQQNVDGSYDIYFGPEPPTGHEKNWLQTVPGKGWNTIFRLYGPLEPFYDQTWKPGDPELVE